MPNINDYLRWRGDLSLEERQFNDVDNVVLAALSYLDFTGIVPGERTGSGIRLSVACERLLDRAGLDLPSYVRSLAKIDGEYLRLLATSRRFGAATLHSYVDIVDDARALQFAALQIDLPSGETYVSFRGTDSTIVGWREDFMLSFMVTEAQREAADYLGRALVRAAEGGRTVRAGGHSKGGNLAMYAAMHCPDDLLGPLTMVYSNDGPGFAPEVIDVVKERLPETMVRRIVPSYSVVGMLFARDDEPRTIVRSTGEAIGQHDPMTWQMQRDGLIEADKLQTDCQVLNQAISAWVEKLPLDEREQATDQIFDALGAGGAYTLDEIGATPDGIQQVLRAMRSFDDTTREVVRALVEGTLNSSMDAASKAAHEAARSLGETARGMAEDAARRLQETKVDMLSRVSKPKASAGDLPA